MQDQTGYAVIVAGMVIVWGFIVYLAATMKPRGPRKWTVIALAFTGVCILVQVLAILARWNVLTDVLVFVGVIAALASFSVAVVWSIRNRQPTEEEPTPAGTFAASTVYMRRRRF